MNHRAVSTGMLLLFFVCTTGVFWASASATYIPPVPPLQNKAVLAGEKLWRSKKIVGRGGETCAGCHDADEGPALDPASLTRKRDDLSKLVFFCVLTRSKNSTAEPDGAEVLSLVQYIETAYRLGKAEPIFDDPRALEIITRARNAYVLGKYSEAIISLNQTLNFTLSPQTSAEAHLLMGCIFDVLGDQKRAREEFQQVLRLYPDARIDRQIFSPKTVTLFEEVRAEASGS